MSPSPSWFVFLDITLCPTYHQCSVKITGRLGRRARLTRRDTASARKQNRLSAPWGWLRLMARLKSTLKSCKVPWLYRALGCHQEEPKAHCRSQLPALRSSLPQPQKNPGALSLPVSLASQPGHTGPSMAAGTLYKSHS